MNEESVELCRVIFANGRPEFESESIIIPFIVLPARGDTCCAFIEMNASNNIVNKYRCISSSFLTNVFSGCENIAQQISIVLICCKRLICFYRRVNVQTRSQLVFMVWQVILTFVGDNEVLPGKISRRMYYLRSSIFLVSTKSPALN